LHWNPTLGFEGQTLKWNFQKREGSFGQSPWKVGGWSTSNNLHLGIWEHENIFRSSSSSTRTISTHICQIINWFFLKISCHEKKEILNTLKLSLFSPHKILFFEIFIIWRFFQVILLVSKLPR
jgi:hypothetical protein